jgi:hypothetical protein
MYRIWTMMKQRCLNPSAPDYANYGGRGITVCERWKNSFEDFRKDMGEPPSGSHTLDRRKNEAGYEPGNCRWATDEEQRNNKRNSHFLTHEGVTKTVAERSRAVGIAGVTIRSRLARGWSASRALTVPATETGGESPHARG